jgi:polysaccharide export outer membrane protein
MWRALSIPFVLIAAFALTACQHTGDSNLSLVTPIRYAPAAQRISPNIYQIVPGDRVRVRVYNESEITGEYEVDSSGYVSIPLAGRVKASRLTTKKLENAITARLADGLLHEPRVNVEIAAYAPFYIQGEVKKAGEYAYRIGLTIPDAVALAGGFTYRADEDKVYLRRAGSTIEELHALSDPIFVRPGDDIRIPERFF